MSCRDREAMPATLFSLGSRSEPRGNALLACQYENKSTTPSPREDSDRPRAFWEPGYVTACRNRAWTLELLDKRTGEVLWVPYKCRSWRHGGDCRRQRGAQDFARIKEALEKRPSWVYLVLTLHRRGSRIVAWRSITKRLFTLRRWIGRNFEGKVEYIALVEQHKDGWPHVNVLIHCPGFVAEAVRDWRGLRQRVTEAALRAGWGFRLWLEPMRSRGAIAGYFVKLCGEVAKTCQAPVAAPKGFRRLRASRGLLPPRHKDPDITGKLLFQPLDITCLFNHHTDMKQIEAMEAVLNLEAQGRTVTSRAVQQISGQPRLDVVCHALLRLRRNGQVRRGLGADGRYIYASTVRGRRWYQFVKDRLEQEREWRHVRYSYECKYCGRLTYVGPGCPQDGLVICDSCSFRIQREREEQAKKNRRPRK